jgi:hypothetical protein
MFVFPNVPDDCISAVTDHQEGQNEDKWAEWDRTEGRGPRVESGELASLKANVDSSGSWWRGSWTKLALWQAVDIHSILEKVLGGWGCKSQSLEDAPEDETRPPPRRRRVQEGLNASPALFTMKQLSPGKQ